MAPLLIWLGPFVIVVGALAGAAALTIARAREQGIRPFLPLIPVLLLTVLWGSGMLDQVRIRLDLWAGAATYEATVASIAAGELEGIEQRYIYPEQRRQGTTLRHTLPSAFQHVSADGTAVSIQSERGLEVFFATDYEFEFPGGRTTGLLYTSYGAPPPQLLIVDPPAHTGIVHAEHIWSNWFWVRHVYS